MKENMIIPCVSYQEEKTLILLLPKKDSIFCTVTNIDLPFCRVINIDLPFCRVMNIDLPFCREMNIDLPFCREMNIDLPFCREMNIDLPFCRVTISGMEGLANASSILSTPTLRMYLRNTVAS